MIRQQDVGGAHQLDVERGVEHVRGRHALMHEARLVVADDLGQMGQEGDDVMLGHRLDLVDAGHVELHVLGFPHGLRVLLRDHAEIGLRVAGMGLDLVPDAELGGGLPDGGHLGAGIAGDHGQGLRWPSGRDWTCYCGRGRRRGRHPLHRRLGQYQRGPFRDGAPE
jgi:hypothetical protein